MHEPAVHWFGTFFFLPPKKTFGELRQAREIRRLEKKKNEKGNSTIISNSAAAAVVSLLSTAARLIVHIKVNGRKSHKII